MVRVVKLTDLMNTNFYSLWLNEKPFTIAKGGRSSMKSSIISIKLVKEFLEDPNGNVVCLRKVGKYLGTSIYEQMKWAIYMLKVEDQFFFGKSPLQIKHISSGTAIYFFGCDDPMKLKSAKIAKGHVMALFFEELAEFSGREDIDIVEDTFIRQEIKDSQVKVYYAYNPPRNPYAWINEWVEEKSKDDDYFIHHSTYLDDKKGFLSSQMVRKIEKYKESDYEYWDWMYNGSVVGLDGLVYNFKHFEVINEIPSDDDILLIDISIDTGHQVSATTFLAWGLTKKGKSVLLDTYYYSPQGKSLKKAPSQMSADLKEFMDKLNERYKKPVDQLTIDSAEGGIRNQFFLDYGIRINPVAKKKKVDMIDLFQDLLVQKRVQILNNDNNQIFLEEHKRLQWDEKTLKTDTPNVVKIDDHTCDAALYYCVDNASKLGLKL